MDEFLAVPAEAGTGGTPTAELSGDWDIDTAGLDYDSEEDSEPERENAPEPQREPADAPEADKTPEAEAPEGEVPPTAAASAGVKPGAGERFDLKHLGTIKQVTKDEVVALAQKGLDYDHLKQKAERLFPLAQENAQRDRTQDYFEALARESGFDSLDQLIRRTQVERYLRDGMDEQSATAKAAVEEERARLRLERAALEERRRTESFDASAKARRSAEIRDFARRFPGVTEIPKPVWESVNSGSPLLYAYLEHQNKSLAERIYARELEEKNRAKTPGSVASSGERHTEADPFLTGWNSV